MKKEKEKLTLEQEIYKRKATIPGKLPFFVYGILSRLPFFGPKYHPSIKVIDSVNDCKGPCFVIWNHQSRRDYLFIKLATTPRRFNMVAGATEFYRSHLAKLFKWVNVIPKKPFYDGDMPAIAGMNRIIKQGGCVCFSPEGTSSLFGDNQPITPGTARFIKHYKIPVYCMDLRGAYLSSHKVDIADRPGKVEATFYLLFTKEDLERMSADEIETKINEVFHHDDYEWNRTKRIRYKTKGNACSHLHDMDYKCPRCGEEFSMIGEGNKIYCKSCGNGATLDDYYELRPFDDTCVIPETPNRWVQWERQQVIDEIRADENYCFHRHVKLGGLPKYETLKNYALSEIQGEGDFTIDHKGVHFVGTRFGEPYEFHLDYNICYTPAIEDDLQTLTFYPNGVSTDIIPADPSGGKMILLIQEMHRLHVNKWKNFPWFDYMYEGKALGIDNKE